MSPSEYRRKRGERSGSRVPAPARVPPPAPAARIRGRVRLTRAGEVTPPAHAAEWRSGEAGAPSERL